MKTAVVHSVCECQARLGAELDEQCRSLRGWARLRNRELSSPANSMAGSGSSFQVGWACPFCTRNTLRVFDAEALAYQEKLVSQSQPPGSRPPPAPVRSSTPTT